MFDTLVETEEAAFGARIGGAMGGPAGDPVKALRRAASRLRLRDRDGWQGAALMAEAEDIAAVIGELETEFVRLVSSIDAAGHTDKSGAAGTAQWLERRCELPSRKARSTVKTARFLARHPATDDAVASRRVPLSKAEVLARVAGGRRDRLYAEHEATLLDVAGSLGLNDFDKAARQWAVLADDTLTDGEFMQRHRARRLHVSTTMHGMVVGDFLLEPIAGAELIRALDANAPPDPADVPDGPRTLPQRRADALHDLAARFLTLRRSETPGDSGGEGGAADPPGSRVPPMPVNVIVDLATLLGNNTMVAGKQVRAEIDGCGPVGRSTIERIACGGHLRRVLIDAASNVLDQGRATRFATPAQRAAVAVRDGGCIGCGRPSHWCDVHHIDGWLNANGPTNIDNLVMLCRRDHTLVHEGRWKVKGTPTGYELMPPDP